jgi:alcohol dehydrogenase
MQANNVTLVIGMGDLGRMKELIEIIAADKLDLTGIVTHRMGLDEAMKAYEIFDKKLDGAIKILLSA